MIVFLLLNNIVDIVLANNALNFRLEDAEHYFDNFVDLYGKTYKDEETRLLKYAVFVENLIQINALNNKSEHAYYGINQYSDLTLTEFLAQHTGYIPSKDVIQCRKASEDSEYDEFYQTPSEFNWRTKGVVSKVKNQRKCASCWAFSVIGNVESINAIRTGRKVELSEQQLVDCEHVSNGCKGGWKNKAVRYLIDRGAMSAKDYRYEAKDATCRYNEKKVAVNVTDCLIVDVRDESKVVNYLYQIGPLSITVDASYLKSYLHGIITGDNCQLGDLNHDVLLVGYGVEHGIPYWLVKNSWGRKWGHCGYFKMQRGVNCLSFLNDPPQTALIGN